MGCRTEPAAVHIAHVLQRLHFFQFFNFFLIIYTIYRKKKLRPYRKNLKKIQFFFIIHTTCRKKKNYTHLPQKEITRLDDFFVHDLHFSQKYHATVWIGRAWTGVDVHTRTVVPLSPYQTMDRS